METIELDTLNAENGVTILLNHMDKYLAKDKLLIKWEHFEEFESYERGESVSMTQYIATFDTLYEKLKSNVSGSLSLPTSILAFKLLKGAKLTDEQRMVVMTGMNFDDSTKLYETAVTSLKKFFGGVSSIENGASGIKTEPTFFTPSYKGRGRGMLVHVD